MEPFKLLMLIWCMQLVNGHLNAIRMCVSYEEGNTAFLNVEWDWRMVNSKGYGIKVVYHKKTENNIKFAAVLFPHNNVTKTKISLNDIVHLGGVLVVVVSIIAKDHNIVGPSSIFQTVANHLHKVVYRRNGDESIEFTCIMACMSPIIEGCAITLKNKSLVDKVINNKTRIQDNKELDNFKLNQVSVQLNGLKPFEHYDYSAIPLIKNKKYALETKGTVAAHRKADKSSSENHHDSQDANALLVLTVAVSVGVLFMLTTGGMMVILWCCYKTAKYNKEDVEAVKKIEEDGMADSNDIDTFNAGYEHNSQPLLHSVPTSDPDSSSIVISSSNGAVTDDCYQHSLNAGASLCSVKEENLTNSPKPNRKMGVITAVVESEDVTEDDSEPLQETAVKRKRWYRLIKPRSLSHRNIHTSPIRSSEVKLQHSSSTSSFKIRFNKLLGRSSSLTPNHQVCLKSQSNKAHNMSASNI